MALPMTKKNLISPWNCEMNSQLPEWMRQEESTGTTIMAVEFDGGVIVGADSRTTSGSYIGNRVTDKLTKIHDRIYCCRSGSAADTQAVADMIQYHLNFLSVCSDEMPKVHTAASLFKGTCYEYRDNLLAGIIVAGWDDKLGGQVYNVPLGGMLVRQSFAIGGSGSTYMYAYVDAEFKENMTKEECLKFVAKGITLAMMRDGSSGGIVRLACITKDGVERSTILGNELTRYYEG